MAENNDLNFQYASVYGGEYTLKPYLGQYADNDNLCLGFHFLDEGSWAPFCYATVNIIPLAYLEGAIDTNDNGEKMIDFLEKNGFGERTPYGVQSGFCVYPIFKFNEDMMRSINPKVFAEYAKSFGKELPGLADKIRVAEEKTYTPAGKKNLDLQR